MGQIHGPSLGSPAAIVTSVGELLVTGSFNPTQNALTNDILINRDSEQLLTEMVKQLKITNTHLGILSGVNVEKRNVE